MLKYHINESDDEDYIEDETDDVFTNPEAYDNGEAVASGDDEDGEEPETTNYENILASIESTEEFSKLFPGCNIPNFVNEFYGTDVFLKPQVFDGGSKIGYTVRHDKSNNSDFPFIVDIRVNSVEFENDKMLKMNKYATDNNINVGIFYGDMYIDYSSIKDFPNDVFRGFPLKVVGSISLGDAKAFENFSFLPLLDGPLSGRCIWRTDKELETYLNRPNQGPVDVNFDYKYNVDRKFFDVMREDYGDYDFVGYIPDEKEDNTVDNVYTIARMFGKPRYSLFICSKEVPFIIKSSTINEFSEYGVYTVTVTGNVDLDYDAPINNGSKLIVSENININKSEDAMKNNQNRIDAGSYSYSKGRSSAITVGGQEVVMSKYFPELKKSSGDINVPNSYSIIDNEVIINSKNFIMKDEVLSALSKENLFISKVEGNLVLNFTRFTSYPPTCVPSAVTGNLTIRYNNTLKSTDNLPVEVGGNVRIVNVNKGVDGNAIPCDIDSNLENYADKINYMSESIKSVINDRIAIGNKFLSESSNIRVNEAFGTSTFKELMSSDKTYKYNYKIISKVAHDYGVEFDKLSDENVTVVDKSRINKELLDPKKSDNGIYGVYMFTDDEGKIVYVVRGVNRGISVYHIDPTFSDMVKTNARKNCANMKKSLDSKGISTRSKPNATSGDAVTVSVYMNYISLMYISNILRLGTGERTNGDMGNMIPGHVIGDGIMFKENMEKLGSIICNSDENGEIDYTDFNSKPSYTSYGDAMLSCVNKYLNDNEVHITIESNKLIKYSNAGNNINKISQAIGDSCDLSHYIFGYNTALEILGSVIGVDYSDDTRTKETIFDESWEQNKSIPISATVLASATAKTSYGDSCSTVNFIRMSIPYVSKCYHIHYDYSNDVPQNKDEYIYDPENRPRFSNADDNERAARLRNSRRRYGREYVGRPEWSRDMSYSRRDTRKHQSEAVHLFNSLVNKDSAGEKASEKVRDVLTSLKSVKDDREFTPIKGVIDDMITAGTFILREIVDMENESRKDNFDIDSLSSDEIYNLSMAYGNYMKMYNKLGEYIDDDIDVDAILSINPLSIVGRFGETIENDIKYGELNPRHSVRSSRVKRGVNNPVSVAKREKRNTEEYKRHLANLANKIGGPETTTTPVGESIRSLVTNKNLTVDERRRLYENWKKRSSVRMNENAGYGEYTDSELFAMLVDAMNSTYPSRDVHMKGPYVYVDGELMFNTDGFNLLYNIKRLAKALDDELL